MLNNNCARLRKITSFVQDGTGSSKLWAQNTLSNPSQHTVCYLPRSSAKGCFSDSEAEEETLIGRWAVMVGSLPQVTLTEYLTFSLMYIL